MRGHLVLLALLVAASPALAQGGHGPISGGGGGGGVGGSTGATDDALLCADGTGGSNLGVCTVGLLDNLSLDGNTVATTNANGNLILNPNGTGDLSLFGETASDVRIRLTSFGGTAAARFITGNAGSGAGVVAQAIQLPNETFPIIHLSGSGGVIDQASGGCYAWYSSASDFSGSRDTSLCRDAAGVVKLTNFLELTPTTNATTCDANAAGRIYHDDSPALCWCDGTSWQKLSGSGTCA